MAHTIATSKNDIGGMRKFLHGASFELRMSALGQQRMTSNGLKANERRFTGAVRL
jgi:hypothetical protein